MGSGAGSSAGTSNWQRSFLSTTTPGAAFFQISSRGRAAFSSDNVWGNRIARTILINERCLTDRAFVSSDCFKGNSFKRTGVN